MISFMYLLSTLIWCGCLGGTTLAPKPHGRSGRRNSSPSTPYLFSLSLSLFLFLSLSLFSLSLSPLSPFSHSLSFSLCLSLSLSLSFSLSLSLALSLSLTLSLTHHQSDGMGQQPGAAARDNIARERLALFGPAVPPPAC
jgi:hypothetical protein